MANKEKVEHVTRWATEPIVVNGVVITLTNGHKNQWVTGVIIQLTGVTPFITIGSGPTIVEEPGNRKTYKERSAVFVLFPTAFAVLS